MTLCQVANKSSLDVRSGKKVPIKKLIWGIMGWLNALNDTKLILNDLGVTHAHLGPDQFGAIQNLQTFPITQTRLLVWTLLLFLTARQR